MNSNTSVCGEKGGYEGDHDPSVKVSFGRPETDDIQFGGLPLNHARSEGGCSISFCPAKN